MVPICELQSGDFLCFWIHGARRLAYGYTSDEGGEGSLDEGSRYG